MPKHYNDTPQDFGYDAYDGYGQDGGYSDGYADQAPYGSQDLAPSRPAGVRGSHAAVPMDKKTAKKMAKAAMPSYMRKSRRMRRVLIAIVVILLILLAVAAFLTMRLLQIADEQAQQQAQTHQEQQDTAALDDDAAQDTASTAKKTTVPDLVPLLGLTVDQAIEKLSHGAQISTTKDVNEEGNPIKKEVRLALTTEPADVRTGTPTVYLGLNEAGAIIQAGYSSSTSSLGYGSLSFADAVTNEHIIEKTLEEAGITVEEGTVTLPADKTAYSTYASDGTTLTKEYCSFSGVAEVAGVKHGWSAVLSYDYMTANATGNLADTVRTIYVYVDDNAAMTAGEAE